MDQNELSPTRPPKATKRANADPRGIHGSDWSRRAGAFSRGGTHPDFVNAFMGRFVFLKLDFPTRTAQPVELKKQNEELRARFCRDDLSRAHCNLAGGAPVAVVDLARERDGDSYRAKRSPLWRGGDLLKQKPLPAVEAKATAEPPPATNTAGAAGESGPPGMVGALVSSSRWTLTVGLGSGALLVIFLMWRFMAEECATGRRARRRGRGSSRRKWRLNDVPTVAELTSWSAQNVRLLVAGLFEAAGYKAHLRKPGGDADIELLRTGPHEAERGWCVASRAAGPVDAKTVRELFGTLISEKRGGGMDRCAGRFSGRRKHSRRTVASN